MPTHFRNVLLTIVGLLAVAAPARAADMTRDEWTADRMKTLPALFCSEGRFFRDCFTVDQDACENAAAAAVQSCVDAKTEDMPETFTDALSRKWDSILEKCVNDEYNEMYANQKKDTPECSQE